MKFLELIQSIKLDCFSCMVLAMLLIFSLLPAPILALSSKQKRVIDSGIYYFNAEASASNNLCSGSTNLVGSENAEKIFNFFISKGLTPIQTAGILGNIHHESGFEPQRLQSTPIEQKTPAESLSPAQLEDIKLGWGIVQFTPPGKFIKNVTPIIQANELSIQLEFVWNQLQGKGPAAESPQILADIKSTTTTREAVLAFQGNTLVGGKYIGYERPADQSGSVDSRTDAALDALTKYGSSSGGASSSSGITTCGENSAGEVVGEFSLPVPKKWYASNKEWFTKDHHDYAASDIPVPEGTPVYSMTAGKIISAPNEGGFGRGVTIDAGNGVQFIYAHGTDGGAVPGARQGDTVKAGQLIMHSSYTGSVRPPGPAGSHLHLEIRINGTKHCPQKLFVGIAEGNVPQLNSLPTTGCWYKT